MEVDEGAAALGTEGMSDEEVETLAKERVRFEVELEFVQCLSNPRYLNYLAQRLVLEDAAFLGYLDYLRYWKRPEYAKFVQYPHCLYFLELLQDAGFREKLKDPQVCERIHAQQFFHWQYYHGKPTKPEENAPNKATAAEAPAQGAPEPATGAAAQSVS